MLKKIGWVLLLVLVAIQFVRPQRNIAATVSANDISTSYSVPDDVQLILKKACNDCHSNNTEYPWYANIQPLVWWLQHHVDEGKDELNFSEFAAYKPKRKAHKLEEVTELVENGAMPLDSYTWMHHEAKLTDAERHALVVWSKALRSKILNEEVNTNNENNHL
jgi:hypothetical protein